MTPAMFNWSGGKDSALALWTALQEGAFDIRCLLTTLSREYARISMHGVRREIGTPVSDRDGARRRTRATPRAVDDRSRQAGWAGVWVWDGMAVLEGQVAARCRPVGVDRSALVVVSFVVIRPIALYLRS